MSQSPFADIPASTQVVHRAVAALTEQGKLSAARQAALVTTLESGSTLAAVTDELGFRRPEECRDAIFDRCVEDWVGGAVTDKDLALHLEVICERSPVAMVQFKELSFEHIVRALPEPEQTLARAFADDIDLAFEGDEPAQRRIAALLDLEQKTAWQQSLMTLYADELEILREPAPASVPDAHSQGERLVVGLALELLRAGVAGSSPSAEKLRELLMPTTHSPIRFVANFAREHARFERLGIAGSLVLNLSDEAHAAIEANPRGWRVAVADALDLHRDQAEELGVWKKPTVETSGSLALARDGDASEEQSDQSRDIVVALDGGASLVLRWSPREPITLAVGWSDWRDFESLRFQLRMDTANIHPATQARMTEWVRRAVAELELAATPAERVQTLQLTSGEGTREDFDALTEAIRGARLVFLTGEGRETSPAGSSPPGGLARVASAVSAAAARGVRAWMFKVDDIVEAMTSRQRQGLAIAADSQLATPELKGGASLAWDLSEGRPQLTITSPTPASGTLTLLDRRGRPGVPTKFELSQAPDDGTWIYTFTLATGALNAFARGQVEVELDD